MFTRSAVFICVIASGILSQSAAADSYDADFALRLPAALTRFAGYADVAAVANTSAGSKWATSVNPASTGFLLASSQWKLGLTPQFSAIAFDEGSRIYIASEALTWESPRSGTFLAAAAQVWSNEASIALGPEFDFEADVTQLQWGIRVSPDIAIGLNLNYTDSAVNFAQSGLDLAHTDSEGIDFRAGVLYQLNPKLRTGIVADYGASLNDNRQLVFAGSAFQQVSGESTTEQFILRPGLSYEYAPDSTIFADYQMVLISDTDAGHADFHRFSAGVDHQLFRGIFIRAGSLVDTTGHFSWSCGAAVSPAKWMSIDLAYQHDFFPELSPELGHSQTLTISMSFAL